MTIHKAKGARITFFPDGSDGQEIELGTGSIDSYVEATLERKRQLHDAICVPPTRLGGYRRTGKSLTASFSVSLDADLAAWFFWWLQAMAQARADRLWQDYAEGRP